MRPTLKEWQMSFKLFIHASCTQKSWPCLLHFFKWSNSSVPIGYFWLVLGASWSRIWNKWFPTKKLIEKDSNCEGSLNNIWENTHWLASLTRNMEHVFLLRQKAWLQFLYWEMAYCSIHTLDCSTELMNHREVVWKALLAISYSNLLSETGRKPTLNWVSHGFVQPSLINLRGRQEQDLSEQPQALTHKI